MFIGVFPTAIHSACNLKDTIGLWLESVSKVKTPLRNSVTMFCFPSKLVEELSKNNGGGDFKWAVSLEERNKLWQARHDVYWSVKALGNNMKVYSTDVCVPISNLVECISWAEKEVKKHDLIAPMVGHVGDGNFHSIILFDPNDKEKQKKIRKYSDDLISKALELEGTITGEHGIGLQKKHYLLKEHPDNIPVMKSIKRSLDVNNIMNPGKVFDLN